MRRCGDRSHECRCYMLASHLPRSEAERLAEEVAEGVPFHLANIRAAVLVRALVRIRKVWDSARGRAWAPPLGIEEVSGDDLEQEMIRSHGL